MASLNDVRARISKHGGLAKLNKYRVVMPTIRDFGVTNAVRRIGDNFVRDAFSDILGDDALNPIGDIVGEAIGSSLSRRLPTTDDSQTLDVLCRSVTIPGKTLNSIVRKTNMKEIQVASGYTVDPVNIRFSETADYMVSKYLDRWLSLTVDPSTYEVGYRDDYVRDIVIVALDEQENPQYTITLKNAFPKTKILVDMSDFSANTITEIAAVFDYEDYVVGNDKEQIQTELTRVAGQVLNIPRTIINSL